MLSYTTPATIKANNARAAEIMAEKGHGVDRHAPTPGKAKTDAFAASLAKRQAG